jgi:hypothetical protein
MLAPVAVFAAETDPAIVFQSQPVGKILDDVRVIVKMVGGDMAIKKFNDGIKDTLGEKGFEGLDLNRPVLGYIQLAPKNLEETTVVVVVPVTGDKEFLGLVERVTKTKLPAPEKGIYELSPGKDEKDPQQAYLRFEGQNAYIAVSKDHPEAARAALQKLVAPGKLHDPSEKSLASIKVHFDRLPAEVREQLGEGLKQMKSQLDNLRLPPDASDAAKKAVDELVKLGTRYTDLLQDAEAASGRVILDVASGEAAIELGLTGKPGSNLAKDIASRKPNTNKFAGLLTPDTVAGLRLQLPFFAKEIQNAAVIGLEAGQKAVAENAPPPFQKLVDETFKGLVRTVKEGECDFAVSFRGPDKDGLYTVVGAVAFDDPSEVEKELRALYKKELPPMYRGFFNLDVAKVGNTSIHQAKIGGLLPPEVQKVFGDEASVTIAFAPNGIFVAFGPDAVNTMKTALEVTKAPAAPFELMVNPKKLSTLLKSFGQDVPEGLDAKNELLPVVALTLEGGKELRLRLGTNLKLFEGLGNLDFPGGAGSKPPKTAEKK